MSAGHGCCRVPAMSDAHDDGTHLAGARADIPPGGQQTHRTIPRAAPRQTPAPAASFMFRYLGAAAIIAVLGIAVVLLVSPASVERSRFASSSARQQPPTYVTAYWIEQVAAKVLPSVVTLQISEGDRSLLGSGITSPPMG